tara:strand:+ start:10967 stop:11221 length:255 start_codon:yes stop_codon:yes gene_type:complete
MREAKQNPLHIDALTTAIIAARERHGQTGERVHVYMDGDRPTTTTGSRPRGKGRVWTFEGGNLTLRARNVIDIRNVKTISEGDA